MNESEKPFACAKQGCNMAFTNEDHLNVHKKKHAMALHLGIDNESNAAVADQTPTPTRFIRNCEEVGLFQDLQNVNPFDETFRKAAELAKTGSLYIPNNSNDDTLHTPHIFPHIEEGNTINKFSRNISNDPEFSVTTIDHNLLKINNKNTHDVILDELKSDVDIEELSLSSESEKLERNSFLPDSDPVISSHSTSVANINYVVPTAVPVPISVANSDIPPAVVNNLSDIIKQNCLKKAESDIEETVKGRLEESIWEELKTEESESDDGDAMVIEDNQTSPSFTNQKLIKSKNKVAIKRAINETPKKNPTVCIIEQPRTVVNPSITKTKINKNEIKPKGAITQTQLERQREVNRAAQVRSREKKKYVINKMESEIRVLRDEKKELWLENQNLKDEIVWLKSMLLYHTNCPVANDPEIKAEINQLVQLSKEELRKKMEKNPLTSKFVPIRPNPRNVIAVSPVTTSVYVQVPNQFSMLTPKLAPMSVDSKTSTKKLHSLLKAKPSAAIISSEKNVASVAVTMPKLLPGAIPTLCQLSVQNITKKSLKPVTIATKSTPNLMVKIPDYTNSSSKIPKRFRRRPKILKANSGVKGNHEKDKSVISLKANQINTTLPNTVVAENNYFVLSKPK